MSTYIDHGGNVCCGESFMAGTGCSLPAMHPGPHGTTCQVCSGDWYMGGCACNPGDPLDQLDFDPADLTVWQVHKELDQADGATQELILLAEAQGKGRKAILDYPRTVGMHPFPEPPVKPVTPEEIAEVFGVDPANIPNIG